MKKIFAVVSLSLLSTVVFAKKHVNEKSSFLEKASYSFGYVFGKSNSIENLDLDAFFEGYKHAYSQQEPVFDSDEMVKVLKEFKGQLDSSEFTSLQNEAQKNLQLEKAFLLKNAKNKGVITTKSGLQYQVITEGSGKKPTINSTVLVNYEGRLLDNTVFDSSIARNEPIKLQLKNVIKGWQEVLPLMSEGSFYRVFVPAKLAYGEIGAGNMIPPNSTLIFDIQLIKVE